MSGLNTGQYRVKLLVKSVERLCQEMNACVFSMWYYESLFACAGVYPRKVQHSIMSLCFCNRMCIL